MYARIKYFASYLPERVLENKEIAERFPEFSEDKIYEKTGIRKRRVSDKDEYATDLAIKAGLKLFQETGLDPKEVDYFILCTQSPDYLLPSAGSKVHEKLGLRTDAATVDYSQGCSGYIHALGLAKGIIESGQARNVLLINSDTITKHIDPTDKSTITLFGDAAAATFITNDATEEKIGPFVYGTDGSGRKHITSYRGGMKSMPDESSGPIESLPPEHARAVKSKSLFMNGPEVFKFTIGALPGLVKALHEKANLKLENVDRYVFHQANGFMLNTLRNLCAIPKEKFSIALEETGNTSSASIPLALKKEQGEGIIGEGDTLVLVGFGVGFSFGAVKVKL